MSVYEVINGMVDEDTKIVLLRRDGYALCRVMDSTIGKMRMDYPWNVVAWGMKVREVELGDCGNTVRLVVD